MGTELDVLVVGNALLSKQTQPPIERDKDTYALD
jgi:hypothetical protein